MKKIGYLKAEKKVFCEVCTCSYKRKMSVAIYKNTPEETDIFWYFGSSTMAIIPCGFFVGATYLNDSLDNCQTFWFNFRRFEIPGLSFIPSTR